MSHGDGKSVGSSRGPGPFFLRGTSALSLNERFSQVLVDQTTWPRVVTFDPVLQSGAPPLVLLLQREAPSPPDPQIPDSSVRVKLPLRRRRRRRRRSVWTRLGWQRVARRLSASRPRGFWSFMCKYRRSGVLGPTCRTRSSLRSRLGQRRVTMRRHIQKETAGQTQRSLHLLRGGATAFRGRGQSKDAIPTKKQLDAQLDEYMSMSRSRLDKELDDYMSMSKRRLDAQLDEYMSLAGQTDLHWD